VVANVSTLQQRVCLDVLVSYKTATLVPLVFSVTVYD